MAAQMTFAEFEHSMIANEPPAQLGAALLALWHDGRGDWAAAHETVQAETSREAAWVHAYLHRKEGDPGNARYWYARAGRPPHDGDVADEWRRIARSLCGER